MRKKVVSTIMAAVMFFSVFGGYTSPKAEMQTKAENPECAYHWDFEKKSNGEYISSGSTESGAAVLKGTAKTETDSIAVGEKNYKGEKNQVLVLRGGSKGSSYVELPANLYKGVNAKTGFSYSFWIKADKGIGSYSRVISSVNESGWNEFAFAPYAADKVWNVLFDDDNTVFAPMPVEPEKGVWSFMTFTVSKSEVIFYLNGEELGTVCNTNLKKRLDSMETLVNNALGKTNSRWSDVDAKVLLDDVSFYKKALTAQEVAAIARAQGIDMDASVKTEAGGANELTDGTVVTDTGLLVNKGDITAKIVEDRETGRYFITAEKAGKVLLDASQLGIKTTIDFTDGLSYVEGSSRIVSGKDEYTLTTGASREICDTYEELSFDLKREASEKKLTVFVRVYEEGVAYRYQWNGKTGEKEKIYKEASEFVLPADAYIWGGYDNAGNYEYEYQKIKMSTVKVASANYSVPLLANSGENWMLFTEADVFSDADTYCASHLKTTAGTRNLKFTFGKGSGSSISMSYDKNGNIHTPWRVAIMTDNLNDIVNSTMVTSLNPAPDAELYQGSEAWIKTGTVAWSWWSEAGDDPIEYAQQKDYIDFAAENGWEYVCLDFGWCLWKNYKNKVKELVDYAAKKNVGIVLWYGVNNDNHSGWKDEDGNAAYPKYSLRTAKQIEEQFAWCESVGVSGVKVDYYERDDKSTMTQMYDCVTTAAKHKINVLFHGCTAPRGEIRTFPNILGYEAVRGAEYYKWNVGPSVFNCLTYVFNRNVVGGMDFTPVGTQIAQLPVTAGFELAQVIAYQTGVQNIASSVYKLEGYKGLAMINDVPAEWDETRLLDGYPGEKVTIARRNGENWYVAAMTADEGQATISLDFLGEGRYKAYIYQDNAQGNDVELEIKEVTKDSVLTLGLAENGGAAIRLSKEEMKTSTAYDKYTFYEAESADNILGRGVTIGENQFASDRKQVIGLGCSEKNTLTFKKITAPEDGVYEMRLYYACVRDRRVFYSVNNGEKIRSRKLNAGVNTLAMEKFYIPLKKGENQIVFGNADDDAPNIDRIAISNTVVNHDLTVSDKKEKVSPKSLLVKVKGKAVKKIILKKGKTVKLAVTVKPANANQKVRFSTSKKSTVTVSAKGVIKAKKVGKARITVKTKDGSRKKVIVVKVK